MTKEAYHHGDLRNDLIKAGLKLLNEEGYDNFSLRKVAKLCSVSHTAPYRHFKDKDALVTAITYEALKAFSVALQQAVDKYPDEYELQLKEMGYLYINFFVKNPDYLELLFLSDIPKYEQSFFAEVQSPFLIFFNTIKQLNSKRNMNEETMHKAALAHWGLVHGLAILISKREYPYEGDCLELARKIIFERVL